jgi:hypothetical protein
MQTQHLVKCLTRVDHSLSGEFSNEREPIWQARQAALDIRDDSTAPRQIRSRHFDQISARPPVLHQKDRLISFGATPNEHHSMMTEYAPKESSPNRCQLDTSMQIA